MTKTHKVKGGGGGELHVVETGNPEGQPILFIHGFSQCGHAWDRQLNSDLANDYRLRLCFAVTPTDAELDRMLEYSVSVPSYVREGLLSRAFDNDDLLRTIRTPVLITHGTADAAVTLDVVEQHKARLNHAQIHLVPGAGDAPFWDDAPAFNRRLREFAESI